MGSVVMPHLVTGWHVDQAIVSEETRLVIIRFGRDWDGECMKQDEVLYKIADEVKNFAVIYVCDIDQVPNFNGMYGMSSFRPTPCLETTNQRKYAELYDPCSVMFFFKNKHMMCDFGTGNNNKMNFYVENKQDLIDIITRIYIDASEGRGLSKSPIDFSTSHRY